PKDAPALVNSKICKAQ
ncbi:hypothetical protein JL09_g6855, partial [Pichia kudriavzevii]